MTRIIEYTEAHYEVEEVELGRVYRWCPEGIVVECECDERPALTSSETTCPECGADHAATARQALTARQPRADEDAHPWRYWRPLKNSEPPF